MNERGLRYDIITGSGTMYVALVVAAALWVAAGNIESPETWGGLAATVVMAYVLRELNNRYSLLRVRSKLISSTFLVLMGTLTFLHPLSAGYLPAVCWAGTLTVLFACYQNRVSQAYVFHVFLFVGLGALVFPQMLFLSPFLLFSVSVQMRAMTLRSFFAGVIGVMLPLAIREACLVLLHEDTMLYTLHEELTGFSLKGYDSVGEQRFVSFAIVAAITLFAVIHFARTKFNDKIRTRMLYYAILVQELAITGLLVAFPADFDTVFRLLVLNSAPLIAHHLAFAGGRAGNVYFYVVIVLVCLLAAYNIMGINLGIWENLCNC